MDAATREAICAAAVRAAKAVESEGAGTIEFIADASEGLRADRIFFMEMNTRLQVEHPVTEAITGVDLVEWQLRVASGEPTPFRQEELSINGHAIEARLYAEDPAKGFLPSTGRLDFLDFRGDARIETGVEQGAEISAFYDPMIAKIISHGDSRDEAITALAGELERSAIWPVRTNLAFLVSLLREEDVRNGDLDTGLIGRKQDILTAEPTLSNRALSDALKWFVRESTNFDQKAEPMLGFRMNGPRRQEYQLAVNGEVKTFRYGPTPEGRYFEHGFREVPDPNAQFISIRGHLLRIALPRHDGTGQASAADGAIIAPMPGKVIALDVAEGDTVTAGQRLMVLEAMKMEHALTAPFDGTVTALEASMGGQVQVEAVLCVVEPAE
ncbi:MAG: biotin/lipoyl-containing protein [Erythrobacter sp.]